MASLNLILLVPLFYLNQIYASSAASAAVAYIYASNQQVKNSNLTTATAIDKLNLLPKTHKSLSSMESRPPVMRGGVR